MAKATLELTDRYDYLNPPDIDSFYGTLEVSEWPHDGGGYVFKLVEQGAEFEEPVSTVVILRPEQIEQLKNFLK